MPLPPKFIPDGDSLLEIAQRCYEQGEVTLSTVQAVQSLSRTCALCSTPHTGKIVIEHQGRKILVCVSCLALEYGRRKEAASVS
jgi:hypothetical protein